MAITKRVPGALLALLLAFAASPASAASHSPSSQQSLKEYALIVGTVWTASEHPAYGVKVFLRRADAKKPMWQGYSDHNGEFAVRIPPGKAEYVLWAEYKGKNKAKLRAEAPVKVEQDEKVEVGLHLTE